MQHVISPHVPRLLRSARYSDRTLWRRTSNHDRKARQTTHDGVELPVQTTEVSDDGTRTYRVRRHGNPSLPLPAILDPIAIAAKKKYQDLEPKLAKQDVALTDFQRELALNPYAQALATPVRQCALTKVRLPSHFLVPFTSEVTASAHEHGKPRIHAELVSQAGLEHYPSPATYLVNDREALDYLNKKTRWTALLSERMKVAYGLKAQKSVNNLRAKNEWTWSEGMPEFVLEKLQADVLRRLQSLAVRKDNKPPDLVELQDLESIEDAACLILLTDTIDADLAEQKHVTAFDLTDLLNFAQLHDFTAAQGVGSVGVLALSKNWRTMRARISLLKLHAFVRGNGAS